MKMLRIPLRIVFYRESDRWVAHCLEFDTIGDGETKEEAMGNLVEASSIQIQASLKHNNPRNLFTPADSKYAEMFAAGKDVTIGEVKLAFDSVTIDRVEAREYEDADPDLAWA